MKITLTIELFALLTLIIGEWNYWHNTSNWRTEDGGWTTIYTYSVIAKKVRTDLRALAGLLCVSGLLVLIWLPQ